MHIVNLKLLNFRNYDYLSLDFSLNNNIIYGNNGTGKTNLVEAIYVLSLTKSFRGTLDKILIQDNKNLTRISGSVVDNIKHDYQLVINTNGKTAKIDGQRTIKLSDYISKINIVFFHPDDLKIIKDSPSIRRSNLNIQISSIDNDYLKILNKYTKLLKQRNSYLKAMYVNSNASKDYLKVLTDKLVEYGLLIYEKRKEYFDKINNYITDIYSKITGINNLYINYVSDYKDKIKDDLLETYNKYLEKDMLFGKTNFGVHHDDYVFKFDDKVLKDYASEGQQKNAIIAYKLSEISIFKDRKGTLPILILDDLFSELDSEKVNNILDLIEEDIQTFITTTDISFISEKIKKNSKIFKCSDDGIMEE